MARLKAPKSPGVATWAARAPMLKFVRLDTPWSTMPQRARRPPGVRRAFDTVRRTVRSGAAPSTPPPTSTVTAPSGATSLKAGEVTVISTPSPVTVFEGSRPPPTSASNLQIEAGVAGRHRAPVRERQGVEDGALVDGSADGGRPLRGRRVGHRDAVRPHYLAG